LTSQPARTPVRLSTPSPNDGVVVTGLGVVSPCGLGVPVLWEGVLAGRAAARWLEAPDKSHRWPACVVDEPIAGPQPDPALRRQDRHVLMAGVAALEAVRHSGMDAPVPQPERTGVVWGTSRGPMGVWHETWSDWQAGRRPRPSLVPAGTLAAGAGALSVLLGAAGPVQCVSAACSSGAHAIATGARMIRAGEADVVIAGGSDCVLHPITLAQFESAGLLGSAPEPSRACRPFDLARNGTVFGEGAGALVLESEAHAQTRGARILARLLGWGLAADAHARIEPDPGGSGLERSVRAALSMASLQPPQIGYVNLHGTGTVANDAAEARVLGRVFGNTQPLCGSTKAATGHCIGATAALEAIIAILALRHGLAPPSTNLESPAFDLQLVKGDARPIPAPCALSTSAGFWGLNACLALGV
jgi:3-oxoacyl-[acyl-carrier-protein] synthase II